MDPFKFEANRDIVPDYRADMCPKTLDILSRTVRERKLHLDFSETPAYGSTYIKGISNLYELDCGEFSGWLYTVNGKSPDVGYSQYKPENGDEIAFTYTCDWRAAYEEEETNQ